MKNNGSTIRDLFSWLVFPTKNIANFNNVRSLSFSTFNICYQSHHQIGRQLFMYPKFAFAV